MIDFAYLQVLFFSPFTTNGDIFPLRESECNPLRKTR